MTRFISGLLSLALILCIILPPSAYAEEAGWYVVDSSSPSGYAYLYSNASDRRELSTNLGKYINGQVVYVLDYYGGQDGKYNYCHVQTQDGKTGYMHDSALRRTASSNWSETSEGWYMVNSTSPQGYTYLYSAASDRSAKSYNKGRYDNGEMVYVMDYYGGQDGKYNYCYVRTQDDKTGYMHDYSLTPIFSYVQGDVSSYNQLSALPHLTHQCWGRVANSSTPVYTGPASSYYRTASGKAILGGGSTVAVYGREGAYYLIQYNATASGTAVPRFSMISASQFTPSGPVDDLAFPWVPIRIAQDAHISDSPDFGHHYAGIDVNENYAYALAQITDESGITWVYFESVGYANADSFTGYASVRGFVPMSEVTLR